MAKQTSPDKDAPAVPAPAPHKGAGASPAVAPTRLVALVNVPGSMYGAAPHARAETGEAFETDAERAAYLVKIDYARPA